MMRKMTTVFRRMNKHVGAEEFIHVFSRSDLYQLYTPF